MNRQLMKLAVATLGLMLGEAILACSTTNAQQTIAVRGANIETATDAGTMQSGIMLIRDGKIEAIGTDVEIPIAAAEIDLLENGSCQASLIPTLSFRWALPRADQPNAKSLSVVARSESRLPLVPGFLPISGGLSTALTRAPKTGTKPSAAA